MASKNFLSALLFVLASASLYQGMAQNTAVPSQEKIYEMAVQKNDLKTALTLSFQLAENHLAQSQYEKALSWYTLHLKHALALKNKDAQYNAYEGIGVSYFNLKQFGKAVDAFEESVAAAQSSKNRLEEMNGLINVAKAERANNRIKRTLSPLEKALQLSLDLKREDAQLTIYKKLAENYALLENTAQAKVYQNLHDQMIQARSQAQKSAAQVSELNKQVNKAQQQVTQAQSEKMLTESLLQEKEESLKKVEDSLEEAAALNRERQMQIDLLSKDKELADLKFREQDAEMKNNRLWRTFLIVGITLSLVLAFVVIVSYRKSLKAKEQIQKQNQNIKSSITYAKRIQEAMLPSTQRMAAYVQESFVLFQPRDVVSGDFYWCSEVRNEDGGKDLAIAAVDCTGHGVPGAFMSMVGMNSLNGIINRGITHSDQILSTLHREIHTSLRQSETGNNDGMDIVLCIYRKDRKILEFSGAKNPLVYIQNNELFQIKGDIHPIGGSKSKTEIAYKKHEVSLDKPTMLYLFSDGYRDQFGGADNTKFMSKKFNQLLLSIHALPLQEQKAILERTIAEWKGEHSQTDDILVMGVRIA